MPKRAVFGLTRNPRLVNYRMKHNPLLNKKEARRRLLEYAKATRHHSFTRVSKRTIDNLEACIEAMIRHNVHSAPSKGQTL